jgi:hypothetical protein
MGVGMATFQHERFGRSDLVEVSGEIRGGGSKAAFRFDAGEVVVWLPRSLCEWDAESGTMAMPEWLALEKGLI